MNSAPSSYYSESVSSSAAVQRCAGATLGLPELTLGILPGFGGTQRLPRLVGLQKGVQMILTSKPIKSQEGLKAGLVDAVVDAKQLLDTAKAWALDMAAGTKHRPFTLYRCGDDTSSWAAADALSPFGKPCQAVDDPQERMTDTHDLIWTADANTSSECAVVHAQQLVAILAWSIQPMMALTNHLSGL